MNVNAAVNYHVVSDKPQAFVFDVDGISGNILAPELSETLVEVEDIRNNTHSLDFDTDGIVFSRSPTKTQSFTNDSNWQQEYDQEVTTLLQKTIGATEVIVFDHTVRVDQQDAVRKPARNVHNDYSAKGAEQRLIDLLGEDLASEFNQGRFGFVNVWHPVDNTITSSPLGFIHPNSIKPEDWLTIELLYPDREGQILGVTANPNHKWFYQSQMSPKEVVIFNIYDNKGRSHLAHSALDIAQQPLSSLPRKSIETRTLVRY